MPFITRPATKVAAGRVRDRSQRFAIRLYGYADSHVMTPYRENYLRVIIARVKQSHSYVSDDFIQPPRLSARATWFFFLNCRLNRTLIGPLGCIVPPSLSTRIIINARGNYKRTNLIINSLSLTIATLAPAIIDVNQQLFMF